jgi:hypothetical protein
MVTLALHQKFVASQMGIAMRPRNVLVQWARLAVQRAIVLQLVLLHHRVQQLFQLPAQVDAELPRLIVLHLTFALLDSSCVLMDSHVSAQQLSVEPDFHVLLVAILAQLEPA